VPIVEPEVLIKGEHNINRAYRVGQQVLSAVFDKMNEVGVYFPATILKPSMITPGDNSPTKASIEEVAAATVECFTEGNLIPSDLAAVAFLSGGQPELDAVLHLNAMNSGKYELPTRFTFSYSRAILGKPLEVWNGQKDNIEKAQKLITERANACGLASLGKLPSDFEYKPN
jgi:fructose-bisphosphate aldolase class I